MTPEIKQRIEQIQNGIVPKGYKQTPFGIYPANWVVGKLGDYIEEYSVLSNEIETYPVYSSSRKGLLLQSQYFDNREAVKTNLGYKMVPSGYVTYRHMSDDDIFYFNRNTTGKTILVSSEYPVFTNSEYGCLDYLITLLNNTSRFRYFCRTQKMGGTRTRLYFKRLCQYRTVFPHITEQLKISEILNTQDKVIELTEKRIEQLKQMKKYYLQNMFPKRGEKVPKIRFKGFTDPWKHRKLSEIVSFSKGMGYSKADLKECGTPIILYGRLYTKYETVISSIDTFADVREGSVYSCGGEIIVPASGESAEEIAIASVVEKPGVLLGGDLNVIIPSLNFDSAFLAINISFGMLHRDIAKLAQGKSVVHLHNSELKKIKLLYPNYEEQVKISSYFRCIDNNINLHQRKLEEEKQKKKSLAQLLLSGIVRV